MSASEASGSWKRESGRARRFRKGATASDERSQSDCREAERERERVGELGGRSFAPSRGRGRVVVGLLVGTGGGPRFGPRSLVGVLGSVPLLLIFPLAILLNIFLAFGRGWCLRIPLGLRDFRGRDVLIGVVAPVVDLGGRIAGESRERASDDERTSEREGLELKHERVCEGSFAPQHLARIPRRGCERARRVAISYLAGLSRVFHLPESSTTEP